MSEYISIIMPCYNEKLEWIKSSIDSILKQTYQKFELIIILDNPNNSFIRDLIIEYSNLDKRIIPIFNEKNMGLSNTLNVGIKRSKYDLIARIDSDDIALPNRLEVQLEFMRNNNVDILGSNAFFINETGSIIGETDNLIKPENISKILPIKDVMLHPTWLFKKKVYNEIGGYYPYLISEDYDFLLRALSKGFILMNLKDKLIYYRVRENSITNSRRLEMLKTDRYIRKLHKENKSQVYNLNLFRNFSCDKISNQELIEYINLFKNSELGFLQRCKNIIFFYFRNKYCRYWFNYQIYSQLKLRIAKIQD
ncbi:glycosyltransferase [Gottfriedia acidiceleris]|uniref:glycosyltransferase n=1 Tax=Gottfriedia acidiceleris TaxID=371036 RepID=UPI002FFF273A